VAHQIPGETTLNVNNRRCSIGGCSSRVHGVRWYLRHSLSDRHDASSRGRRSGQLDTRRKGGDNRAAEASAGLLNSVLQKSHPSRLAATGMAAILVADRTICRTVRTARRDRSERTIIPTRPRNPKRDELVLMMRNLVPGRLPTPCQIATPSLQSDSTPITLFGEEPEFGQLTEGPRAPVGRLAQS